MSAWLHAAVGCDGAGGVRAVAYLISRRRGVEASALLLGPDYEGNMTHDGYASYEQFILALHQSCLDHLMRRCRTSACFRHDMHSAAMSTSAFDRSSRLSSLS